MTEKSLQNNFSNWLKRRGIVFVKNQAGLVYMVADYKKLKKLGKGLYTGLFRARQLKSGFSDIQVFNGGQTMFFELKQEDKYLRTSQSTRFIQLHNTGFKYLFVLKPSGYDLLKKLVGKRRDLKNVIDENEELLKEKKILWKD